MVPYLKGIHLTTDGWRKDRDEEGFKVKGVAPPLDLCAWRDQDLDGLLALEPTLNAPWEEDEHQTSPPTCVTMVLQLHDDISALFTLTRQNNPPTVRVMPDGSIMACFLIADASRKEFGSAL